MPKLWKREDLVGTKFVHWSIDRPGTGQEIHRIGTCITRASNVFLYETSYLSCDVKLSDCCSVTNSRTLRNLFRSIVSSVSLALQGISFNRLLRQYPSHSQESLSIDCFISIPCTHRSLSQSIVTSVSLALIGVSFNRLLRQYPSHSQESLSIDCYVSISLAL